MAIITQKGLLLQQSAEACMEEEKGKEYAYTDHFERGKSQFSEDLQTLLVGQLCLAAL